MILRPPFLKILVPPSVFKEYLLNMIHFIEIIIIINTVLVTMRLAAAILAHLAGHGTRFAKSIHGFDQLQLVPYDSANFSSFPNSIFMVYCLQHDNYEVEEAISSLTFALRCSIFWYVAFLYVVCKIHATL